VDISQKSHLFSGLYFRVGMDWYDRQDRVYSAYNTETPTPGYTLFEAGMGTDLLNRKKKNICSIHLSASNLFDVAYQSHLSRLKYFEPYPNNPTGRSGIFDMGRNIGFKVLFPF
jgi:iron complex outermembrane receptor protein